jgi:large subunit ribosomal protein L6
MKQDMNEELEIPKGVTVTVNEGLFTIKGPKGELKRTMKNPHIDFSVSEGKILISSKKATQREKKIIKTAVAHLKYMMKGVEKPHVYKLKICSSHFPMTVAIKGNIFEIKNYIGESVPRLLTIPAGVSVKADGQFVIVESVDKELAGRVSAWIERLTKRTGFDKRIFQDGLYLIEKDGKPLK